MSATWYVKSHWWNVSLYAIKRCKSNVANFLLQSELDLDQKALVELSSNFSADAFAKAKKVYTEGGNSESYATLTLSAPLVFSVSVGTIILGLNSAGSIVTGVAYEDASVGTTTLKFKYAIEAAILPCCVGGLQNSNTTGCTFNEWYMIQGNSLYFHF